MNLAAQFTNSLIVELREVGGWVWASLNLTLIKYKDFGNFSTADIN
jgi:hypothetical protein